MKLYYTPGACSLSPHIILREAGLDFELERVDLATKKTESGGDFRHVNPMGYVPALRLDDGEILTEGVAIMQFLADQQTGAQLVPQGGRERARLQVHLNFIASELHKAFGPLFRADASEQTRQDARAYVARRLDHIEALLADGRPYLMGAQFSVADAYLFTVASWAKPTGIGLERWPNLKAFVERVAARETVRAAMRAEGAS